MSRTCNGTDPLNDLSLFSQSFLSFSIAIDIFFCSFNFQEKFISDSFGFSDSDSLDILDTKAFILLDSIIRTEVLADYSF